MPGTFLNYPFDEEIFHHAWQEYPDLTTRALIGCGVISESAPITNALANGGNYFTVPHYMPLTGNPVNYDGTTDITITETTGGSQSGVAYARAAGWGDRDFIYDFHGNDPMGHIVSRVGRFWADNRQARLVKILDAVLGATGLNSHSASITEDPSNTEQLLGDLNVALATMFGKNKNNVRALVMDTLMATKFENIKLLKFRKGVDANGVERNTNIADLLGYTVVVDDTAMAGKSTNIYALGTGAILTGKLSAKVPVEVERDAKKNGGEDHLITRVRDVLHPNGFTFSAAIAKAKPSPSDVELGKAANYTLVYPEKSIIIGKIIIAPGIGG